MMKKKYLHLRRPVFFRDTSRTSPRHPTHPGTAPFFSVTCLLHSSSRILVRRGGVSTPMISVPFWSSYRNSIYNFGASILVGVLSCWYLCKPDILIKKLIKVFLSLMSFFFFPSISSMFFLCIMVAKKKREKKKKKEQTREQNVENLKGKERGRNRNIRLLIISLVYKRTQSISEENRHVYISTMSYLYSLVLSGLKIWVCNFRGVYRNKVIDIPTGSTIETEVHASLIHFWFQDSIKSAETKLGRLKEVFELTFIEFTGLSHLFNF